MLIQYQTSLMCLVFCCIFFLPLIFEFNEHEGTEKPSFFAMITGLSGVLLFCFSLLSFLHGFITSL